VGTKSHDLEFGWKDEKALRDLFIVNDATRGRWPDYDQNDFPNFLRYIIIFLYLHFQKRSENALKVRLGAPAVSESITEFEREVKCVLTLMIAELVPKIGDFRSASSPPTPPGEGSSTT
jgi:hypothetical protein